METELITINDYCNKYAVEPSFIVALEDSGLIVLTVIEDNKYIHYKQLVEMERFIHFHYELQINIEGIEAIMGLLQKIKRLQHEIETLKSQVHLHEPGH
ncbi:MerR HTH family regulatory protein [Pedobacter westerhofensis]|uniref:MerR HTH family regulatory protein n=1 Tax=Pedobacter westerhofensis TaxID=425512 RepID=A0A521BMD9_9SPHI|nr:chaperone modulator CbpM [Pedobacter westerhofensis]SMO48293.1 MerR HTH family regulatory protein [Pedobacter westerhofensis]